MLIETHTRRDLERALTLESRLIGFNNRDLRSFETRSTSANALCRCPKDRIVVAESGIDHADCRRLAKAGIQAFLVGESLMRETTSTKRRARC